MNDSSLWKQRYYELEAWIETMLRGFKNSLERLEENAKTVAIDSVEFQITHGDEYAICLANGPDLEYAFHTGNKKEVVDLDPAKCSFSKMNCIPLRAGRLAGHTHIFAAVRSAKTGQKESGIYRL